MQELIKAIEQWAEDRNIIKGSKPIDQAMKLFSEFGELADNVGKGRDCRDDIGDIFVVLTIMCKQYGKSISSNVNINLEPVDIEESKPAISNLAYYLHLASRATENTIFVPVRMCLLKLKNICINSGYTLQECVQIAYNDIKDRKGLMHNGVFVKESDPVYASIVASIESNC
ncbi:MAG: MazG-like family protein [Acinetobacter sp.]